MSEGEDEPRANRSVKRTVSVLDNDDEEIDVSGDSPKKAPLKIKLKLGKKPAKKKKRQESGQDNDEEYREDEQDRDVDDDMLDDDENKAKKKDKHAPDQLKGVNGGYSWEDEYRRSWDVVQEDESGSLETIVSGLVESQKKRYLKNVTPFQRGIIRTMVLVLDYSKVMREKDLRPNRAAMMISYAIDFVGEFFDQNPISQLSIVAMRNGLVQMVSEVGGNPHDHIEALKRLKRTDPEGDPSLQNALEMSRGLLLHVAAHCSREVLIIFGALFTSDPGNIHNTIKQCVKEKISVRVIGLTARVAICDEMCSITNHGDVKSSYNVILNEQHFRDLFMDAVTPLAVTKGESEGRKGFTLVKMGFPQRVSEDTPSFCACHSRLVYGGYMCPNCKSKVCMLPTVCPCCDLMLILSTHLARSYHHLFPLKLFVEVPVAGSYTSSNCYGCHAKFPGGVDLSQSGSAENKRKKEYMSSSRYQCSECGHDFCIDCDVFVHEVLHNCPGCESDPSAKKTGRQSL